MSPRTNIISLINLAASLCLIASAAQATKLNAPPLPHERDDKDFSDAQEYIVQPTLFKRRPDPRDAERDKKQAAEDAQKKAIQDREQAREQAIDAVKKQKEVALDANNRAVAAGKLAHWSEAIALHETAVQYDPQNKQYRINLSAACVAYGQEKLQAKDFVAAEGLFRKALGAASDNGLAGKLLADAMRKNGADPDSCDARLAKGDQLAAVGDLASALIEYQAAMALEPSARTYTKMGDMALRTSQWQTAITWYRQAIVKNPEYGPAHRQLGLLAMSQKDLTAAAASLRKAVIIDPKDQAAAQSLVDIWRSQVAANPLLAENHLGLAGAYQLTGDFEGAESEYNKLEALDSKNSGLVTGRESLKKALEHAGADKHKLAAETLFNQGLKREALSEISQAAMLEPRNASYQFLLGECLEAEGDYQGAHQAYLTCVLIDPENNKEAAARLKSLEGDVKKVSGADFQRQVNDLADKLSAHFDGNSGQATQNPFAIPQKLMYETQAKNPPQANQAQTEAHVAESSQQASAPVTTGGAQGNIIEQIGQAEAQKNYAGASALLRFLLSANLQDANIHHRLAANLLAAGQVVEALSEFRIASALAPTNRQYADDLAHALAVHKESLVSSTELGQGGGK